MWQVSPCVLPVLPVLLSASGTGGRRRPSGVVAGLMVAFFITIVGFAAVVKTVESHLARSFHWLDIRSRRDVPAALEDAA